jgi:ribosome biogenesis protein MAK21
VYKNPKKKASGVEGKGTFFQFLHRSGISTKVRYPGASAMQPAGSAVEGVKLRKGEMPDVQVNMPAFWKKKDSQIPVDQMFFYNYFRRKEEKERKIKKKHVNEDEEEEVDEAEEDEEREDEEEGSDGTRENVEHEDEEDYSDLEEDEVWKVSIQLFRPFQSQYFFARR